MRRFGKAFLADGMDAFDELAPDAFLELPEENAWATALSRQRVGVKALLLNQKKLVSGVGNWIADEVRVTSGLTITGTLSDSPQSHSPIAPLLCLSVYLCPAPSRY